MIDIGRFIREFKPKPKPVYKPYIKTVEGYILERCTKGELLRTASLCRILINR